MKRFFLTLTLLSSFLVFCIAQKHYLLKSPNGELIINIEVGDKISYSLQHKGKSVIVSSPISMLLDCDKTLGEKSKVKNVHMRKINETISTAFYKRNQIDNFCNELVITFKEDFQLNFRAYNEGMAYRFVVTQNRPFIVINEEATFNFEKDYMAYVPFVRGGRDKRKEEQFFNSFENVYTHLSLSEMPSNQIAFTPVVVELEEGRKICIAESDVESYPGMFVYNEEQSTSLKGVFAPYPKNLLQGGHNNLQMLVTERENYIAKCSGKRTFPWRIAIVSSDDKELLDNDLVYKLAAPSRIDDTSWIKPGKVAWEWWNHWGLSGIDFKAGVNNATYKAYIDFAAKHGIEYVILDEGWAVNLKADLFQVVPEIDLKELVAYAESKDIGLILWAGYYAFERDMEDICRYYSELGIKGFKVDFMDRDDQPMVDFHYRGAAIAAKYHLLLDYHGTYKPTGLNRTYPNVVNFEGVHGLEQLKFAGSDKVDQVTYDVTMPYIRMVAGPVDYTQGAMRNGTKRTFRPVNEAPMSMGTRCRQLAEYVIFESPLSMLCDSPVFYERESECTSFIAEVPTVWEETVALDGKIGEYISMARRKGDIWYLGTLTNWEKRTMEIDLSFLGDGEWSAELYKDGVNAGTVASDYIKSIIAIPQDRKLSVTMAEGGGCALKIYKK